MIYDYVLSQNPKILSFLIGTTYPLPIIYWENFFKITQPNNNSSRFMLYGAWCGVWGVEGTHYGLVRLTVLNITPKTLKKCFQQKYYGCWILMCCLLSRGNVHCTQPSNMFGSLSIFFFLQMLGEIFGIFIFIFHKCFTMRLMKGYNSEM